MHKNKQAIIIGYSLDAVMLARELVNKYDKQVTFLKTGTLGYPLDDISDYISYEDVVTLQSLGVSAEYKKLINGTYVFLPYEKLKFINTRNGLLSYPLNKSTFDSAEEWEQLEFCLHKMKEFRDALDTSTNFINIYKNFFPKWLFDSLLKYISINKWDGIKQSHLSREGLAKELNLSYMDCNTTGTVYKPVAGYNQLCNQLLDHPNIKIEEIGIEKINKMLTKRYQNIDFIIADNRIDYICNYTYGNFDRIQFDTQEGNFSKMEEFIDINEGIVLTPMKDYWGVIGEKGSAIKLYSKAITELNYTQQSEIPMSTTNVKLYGKYKKMLTLYSGKVLDLSGRVITTVR